MEKVFVIIAISFSIVAGKTIKISLSKHDRFAAPGKIFEKISYKCIPLCSFVCFKLSYKTSTPLVGK